MRNALIVLLAIALETQAQITITPFAGVNSTSVDDNFGYSKGGTFLFGGLDVELRKKSSNPQSTFVTLATGINYLSNGYYESSNFAFTTLIYNASVTDLKTSYLQVPAVLRLNVQPFPLVEQFHGFLGLGIVNNFLLDASLKESRTFVTYTTGAIPPPPTIEHYEDEGDIKSYAPSHALFRRIEVGMKFKRLFVSYRISVSLTDMYSKGLEDDWNVPDEDSPYIQLYNEVGKRKERYAEIVIGYRLGKTVIE